jgi:Fungal specific transcription factor domain
VVVDDYADLKGPSLLKKTLGLQNHRHSRYVGTTAEFEPHVINFSSFDRKDEYGMSLGTLRRVDPETAFLMKQDNQTQNYEDEIEDLDAIESIVAPHGQALINIYFRIVHPTFPILHEKAYLEKYSRSHREFSPPLLAAVYLLALNLWSDSPDLASLPKPDIERLNKLAARTISEVMYRPKLSTIQAGLLLTRQTEDDNSLLTAKLVAIGQDLGLHLDCSNWKIPPWERGLRKRLAWALYFQDKWGSLKHGLPSHIVSANWAVRPVSDSDFSINEDEEEDSFEVEKGKLLFDEMIALTGILAEVLDTFFTLRAESNFAAAGQGETRMILKMAKPVQLKLKEWYGRLPGCLKMDYTKAGRLSSIGKLFCLLNILFSY